MHFIDVIGFDIKEGKMGAYQQWVKQNEKELAAQMPEGAEYLGTFVAIYNSEKDSGSVFMLTKMESYGTADKIAALGSNAVYSRLVSEAMEFMDQSNTSPGSRMLLKSMSDATIWG